MYGYLFSRINLLNTIRNLLPSKHLSEVYLCVIYNEIIKKKLLHRTNLLHNWKFCLALKIMHDGKSSDEPEHDLT